jgi:hypothetical protein
MQGDPGEPEPVSQPGSDRPRRPVRGASHDPAHHDQTEDLQENRLNVYSFIHALASAVVTVANACSFVSLKPALFWFASSVASTIVPLSL